MPRTNSNQLAFAFPEPRLSFAKEPPARVPDPAPTSSATPMNTAEALALKGLRRMLPEGSVPLLYRKVLSARWEKLPVDGRRVEHAVVDFELFDGEPATIAVCAHVERLRSMTKTGMHDKTGEEIELMVTQPTVWWSMRWTRSDNGTFEWVEHRRRWERRPHPVH